MTCCAPIIGAEATRWAEIKNCLLHPTGRPPDWGGPSPFRNSTWNIVLVAGAVASAVEGPDSGGWPCRDGLPDILSNLDPLRWCLEKRGAEKVVVSTDWDIPGAEPRDEGPRYCKASPGSVEMCCELLSSDINGRPRHGHSWENMLFDASEEWLVCDTMENVHLLGGTPAFMDQYFEAAGGEDYVRAWFYHYDMLGCGGHRAIGSRVEPEEYLKALYDLAGWPYPDYTLCRDVPADHDEAVDIDWRPLFGDRITSCGPTVAGYWDR